MLTNKDIEQIEQHSLTLQNVEKQIAYFRSGFPFLNINRAAVAGDGITRMDDNTADKYCATYNESSNKIKTVKFVPASGAATRMFKELFEYVDNDKQSSNIDELLSNIKKFAFADELTKITGANASSKTTVNAIIRGEGNDGLGYGKLPKALILFHKYNDGNRTALEEHLSEGALYAAGSDGMVNIHFTVSPEHHIGFESKVAEVLPLFEKRYGVKYNISYSYQRPSTDTIAVNPDNTPFREADGTLLFRPAGHGALIENLNDIDADIIFIKTIDNVVPDSLKGDTVKFKKALAGMLLSLQKETFKYLSQIDNNKTDDAFLANTAEFAEKKLNQKLPENYNQMTPDQKKNILYSLLNRPIRVCGMVKNEGEPGGGPFWVNGTNGGESLQIAESSQISPEQVHLMKEATHFNPVDIICGVRNHKGEKFNLTEYVDPSTGFISSKSKDGRELKAQELPGLWNGAMAKWNTIFAEVPISTFSPVKIVNDLLRSQHQQKTEQ